jgi:hypothetical protein
MSHSHSEYIQRQLSFGTEKPEKKKELVIECLKMGIKEFEVGRWSRGESFRFTPDDVFFIGKSGYRVRVNALSRDADVVLTKVDFLDKKSFQKLAWEATCAGKNFTWPTCPWEAEKKASLVLEKIINKLESLEGNPPEPKRVRAYNYIPKL